MVGKPPDRCAFCSTAACRDQRSAVPQDLQRPGHRATGLLTSSLRPTMAPATHPLSITRIALNR
jgi:hypothetical protein